MRFKRSYYFFLAIIVLPLIFLLQKPAVSDPIHKISFTIIKPVILAGNFIATSFSSIGEKLIYFWNTFQDQGRYEAQIQDLTQRLVGYDELKRENERLTALLAFKGTVAHKSIAARVIGWDISPWRKIIVLDKGRLQGIRKDMAVLAPTGLVGRVLEIGPTSARVILLIDPDARVNVLGEQSRSQGIAAGDGSDQLTNKYFDLDSGISVGETLLTSGNGGLYPKGLPVGNIESVKRDDDGLHLSGRVKPFVNFSRLEEVLCLEYFQAE